MLDSVLAGQSSEACRLLRELENFRESVRGFRFAEWLAHTGEPAAVFTPVWRDLSLHYGVSSSEVLALQAPAEIPEAVKPLLKHLTPEILLNLFDASCAAPNSPSLAAWAPALLRGSELNQGRLVPKFRELWRTDEKTALRAALLLASVLERYGAYRGDLRYLNAVLKIIDALPSLARARASSLSGNGLLWLYLGVRARRQLGELT